MYKGAVRVPMLISGAGVAARGINHALVELVDLYPTILDLAGVSFERDSLDGISVAADQPEQVTRLLKVPTDFDQMAIAPQKGREMTTCASHLPVKISLPKEIFRCFWNLQACRCQMNFRGGFFAVCCRGMHHWTCRRRYIIANGCTQRIIMWQRTARSAPSATN